MRSIFKQKINSSLATLKSGEGFTLMEIVVATTIFALVLTSMMTLLNYTLKINRRAEALRQATQGMRNFIEFLVKEVRNGQIYYGVENGATFGTDMSPCGDRAQSNIWDPLYWPVDNKLWIKNLEGDRECFYLATGSVGSETYVGEPGNTPVLANLRGKYLMVKRESASQPESLNPQNFTVEELRFIVRPARDPYVSGGTGYPRLQPFVTIVAKFSVLLPTGEKTELYYQTSVSTNKYDIPH